MDKEINKAFYVDAFEGAVKESNITEIEKDGLWLKVDRESMNTFVHSEMIDKVVYKQRDDAQAGLVRIRTEMKARLLQNSAYIHEIHEYLEHHEGKLYADIIEEILQEKN